MKEPLTAVGENHNVRTQILQCFMLFIYAQKVDKSDSKRVKRAPVWFEDFPLAGGGRGFIKSDQYSICI